MQSQSGKIISVEGVSMLYDKRYAVRDINLDVFKGDFIAVTGPNGGGKTTLLRIILKLLKPTSGRVAYYCDGVEIKDLNIGYLPQKNMIDSRFPITVREVVASGLLCRGSLFGNKRASDEAVVDAMMRQVGVDRFAEQAIGTLSGGQLQRTLLGRALISGPEVVVLDEPLSYVDKSFEHQIYSIIADIAPTTTLLLVSHEMTEIAPMANRHIIIDQTLSNCHRSRHYAIERCDD